MSALKLPFFHRWFAFLSAYLQAFLCLVMFSFTGMEFLVFIIFKIYCAFYILRLSFKSSLEDMFINFRERGRERETLMWEAWLVAAHMCPDQRSNPQPCAVWYNAPNSSATLQRLHLFVLIPILSPSIFSTSHNWYIW